MLMCSDKFVKKKPKKRRDCAGLRAQNVWTALEPRCHVSHDFKPVSHHDELAARPKPRSRDCKALERQTEKLRTTRMTKCYVLRTESHTTATLNWQPSSPHLATPPTGTLLLISNFLSQNLAGDQAVDVEQHCGVL